MSNLIEVNIKDAAAMLYGNILAGITTFLLGQPGLGKTSLIIAIWEKLKDRFPGGCFVISTTENNPIDLAGLYVVQDGRTVRCPSSQIPFDKPVLVLIDEFSDCPAFEQSSWYRFLLNKTIGEHSLADGSYVCAAGNRPDDRAAAREISTAAKTRCACITMKACHIALIEFAQRKQWPAVLIGFLRCYGAEVVDAGFDPDMPYGGSTPRDFEHLAKLELAGQLSANPDRSMAQIVSFLDHDAGARYAAFRSLETPDPQLVLDDPQSAPIPDSVELQYAYCAAVLGKCQESQEHYKAVTSYCLRCNRVMGFGLFWDLASKYPNFKNSPSFAKGAVEYQHIV